MARVSRAEVEADLRKIADLIREHPEGISRQAIADAYQRRHHKQLADRTLQRRLEQLVVESRAVAQGEGPATKYAPRNEDTPALAGEEEYVPLSVAGKKTRDLVRKPMSARKPVGYDPDWLLRYTPGRTWYLTKAQRARLHDLGRTPDEKRPAGTFARDILGRLLIDLAWASSRLEGNTYTRLDTQNLLEFGQRAEGKDAQEAQMILNHKVAIEYLVSEAEHVGFNRATVLTIHAALSENLLGDPGDEGRLRVRPVSISGTSYTPTAIPQVIEECFDRIMESAARISEPFECAFFAMVHIPYLQPFADVNKRTSRLMANLPLIRANLCPLSFVDVPEKAYVEGTLALYEQRRVDLLRDVFLFAYERSCAQYRVVRESLGQPDPIRLRFRNELAEAVLQTVRAAEPPRVDLLRRRAAAVGVPSQELDVFAERALALLVNLQEGSAGRYGLRPSEFQAWKDKFQPA